MRAAGGVWADQLINMRRYRNRLTTFFTLSVITAMFVAVSLLPLVDPWYIAAGLLSGACLTTILLLLAKVGGLWEGCSASMRAILSALC